MSIKQKYGLVPTSVLNFEMVPRRWRFVDDLLDIDLTRRSNNTVVLPKLKYSKFSYGLSEFVCKYWSEKGDIILDPFMGWGIRGAIAILLDRKYIGYDVSDYMFDKASNFLYEIPDLLGERQEAYTLHKNDGCLLEETEDDSIDLLFTCPPYYDREIYPDGGDAQLSTVDNYDIFLESMLEHMENSYRAIKPSKFAVYVVADWRDNGLRTFHIDLINMGREVGYQLWDLNISVLNSPYTWWKCGANERMKYTAKSHEFLVVFKK